MTSRNYLFNSIKENIRRNFYLLILLSVSMLAVLPAYTIMQMELAPLQYPAMGSSLNSSQEMLLKCLDSTNQSRCTDSGYRRGCAAGYDGFFLPACRKED